MIPGQGWRNVVKQSEIYVSEPQFYERAKEIHKTSPQQIICLSKHEVGSSRQYVGTRAGK